LAVALAVLGAIGCGSKGNVKGTVYYKDKPLPAGVITFVAKNRKVGTATIQSDGAYVLKNVAAGEVTIVVTSGAVGGKPAVPIPQEYSDAAKSKEKYTVTSGDQEHDIKLK